MSREVVAVKDMKKEIGREAHDIVRGALELKQEEPYSPERRTFLVLVILACGGIISAIVGLPLLGLFLQPLLQTPKAVWRVVGKVDDFAVSTTTQVVFQNAYAHPWNGVSSKDTAWLRRVAPTTFVAFSDLLQQGRTQPATPPLGRVYRGDARAHDWGHDGLWRSGGVVAALQCHGVAAKSHRRPVQLADRQGRAVVAH